MFKSGRMAVSTAFVLSVISGLCGEVFAASAPVIYVKASSAGGDGTSWQTAFNSLDAALTAVRTSGKTSQIWITGGLYKPSLPYGGGYSGTEPNLVTFNLPSNVSIYGGFNGNESSLSQRDFNTNPTILSGDLNGNDVNTYGNFTNKSDNAWHVLTADGVINVVLDGITVRGGYAAGPDSGTSTPNPIGVTITSINYAHNNGGGLLARHGAGVTLNDTNFSFNASDNARATLTVPAGPFFLPIAGGGGAVSAVDEGTLVRVQNSTFTNNAAPGFGGNGGALNALTKGAYRISDSDFTNNQANRIAGAIHGRDAGDIQIAASSFQNNQVKGNVLGDESGGAIGVMNTNLKISDSTFDLNKAVAASGGGGAVFYHLVFDDGEVYTLTINNSVFTTNMGSNLGGGAVNIFGISPNLASSAKISGSIFSGNVAGVGGGVSVDSVRTDLTGNTFNGNKAWTNGGAVFGSNLGDVFSGGNIRPLLTVSNATLVSNSLIGVPVDKPPTVGVFNFISGLFSNLLGIPPVTVSAIVSGGGGVAAGFGANVRISNSKFTTNSATQGIGGAILVGGVTGSSGVGGTSLAIEKAYVNISKLTCTSNTDQTGQNNIAISAPNNIVIGTDGVQLASDSSCR